MVLFKQILALLTGCLWLVISEAARSRTLQITSAAPTSLCDMRPIDFFYFQMDVLFENDAQLWADILDSSEPEVGAAFQPFLDAANQFRDGASSIMFAITNGCASTYPKTEPPTVSKATKESKGKATKLSKELKEAKSSKMPKQAKADKSSKDPKSRVLKESKEANTKSSKASKEAKSSKAPKEAKSSKAPKTSTAEAELDVPALILAGIGTFTDNVYFMNSYNTVGGTAWTFGSVGIGFEAIPVRDITLAPGAFNSIVCGYKSLVDTLVLTHQGLTGAPNTALDYKAELVAALIEYYGGSIVDYC